MNLFQGWKVKIYTFITLLLFVTGAAYALWPRNNVASVRQGERSDVSQAHSLQATKQDEKETAKAVVDEATDRVSPDSDTESDMSPVEAANNMPETTDEQVSTPTTSAEPETTPVVEEKITPAPLDVQPIVDPVIKTVRCGCTLLRLRADVLCPQKVSTDYVCDKPAY